MGLLQKLFGGFSARTEKRYYPFSVKCMRCGELIGGRVDLDNDLSIEYEEKGEVYHARKVLMGSGKCFQRLEVTLKFKAGHELIDRQATGGEFV